MKRPELLAPAGNFEKMRSAILYGADAVYLAGQIFGMRAAADNFSVSELREAVKYAHERGVKVYLTLNTMPREYEYDLLKSYLADLADVGLDAMIIATIHNKYLYLLQGFIIHSIYIFSIISKNALSSYIHINEI